MRAGDGAAFPWPPAASRVPHRRRRGRAAGDRRGAGRRVGRVGRGRHPGARLRSAVFRVPHAVTGRHEAGVDQLEPPEHALGREELRVGSASGGTLDVADTAFVMGGPDESVLAPLWRDDATLYVLSDASGWWNPYEVAASAGAAPRPLHPLDEEFAGPMWQLGGRPFELLGDGRLAVLHGLGEHHLGLLDPASGELTDLDLPGYRTTVGELAVSGTTIATVAGGPRTPWSVLRIAASGEAELMKRQPATAPDPAYLPDARPVQLSGERSEGVIHAIVYPPANPGVTAPDGELPPFLVHVHGGPTSHSLPVLSMEKAFFTSRGIGVIDVNYGGSTGFGREYRNRLRGQWGIVDVADAYAAALGLAEAGEADRGQARHPRRLRGRLDALVAVTTGPALTGTKEAVFAAATLTSASRTCGRSPSTPTTSSPGTSTA